MSAPGERAGKRILLITAGELTHDPRGRRAAETAARLGLRVQGLCVSDGPGLAGFEVARVPRMRVEQRLREAGAGRIGRSSALAREARGLYRLWRHAWITLRLALAGRRIGRFDIVHANDFDTLPAGAYLARRSRARLVYDSHELYVLQEPSPPRAYTEAVRLLESALARRSDAVITVSPAFAERLAPLLGLETVPQVVLSCPSLVPLEEPAPREGGPLRAIYQSSVGPGRFHEDVLLAAEHADGALISIRMAGIDVAGLRAVVSVRGLGERVEVLEPAPPDRLVEALHGFEVGLIINRPVTANDELTLPNKVFEYMMAGLAVVTPALPVLGAFVEREGVGLTFPPGDAAALGRAIARLASDGALLQRLRSSARRAAVETYNAEVQAPALARAWGLAGPGP